MVEPQYALEAVLMIRLSEVFVYQNDGPCNQIYHLGPGDLLTVADNESYKAADGSTLTFTARIHAPVDANGDVTIA